MNTFFKPLAASGVMGVVAFALYYVLNMAFDSVYIAAVIAIGTAVIVYGIVILQIRCFSDEELESIPGGHKLTHLIR